MTQTKPNLSLSELRAAADRARTAYQWEEAVAHYTQALALPNLPPGDEYTLRDGRAACYQRLANFQAEHDDLAAMADLAQAEEESERYLDALTRQAIALSNLGEIEDSRSLAAEALETAQKSEARFYEGRALYALGLTYITTGEYERAAQELEAAIQFIQRSGALQEEALCAYQIAFAGYYMGQKTDRYAQRVLEIANQLDDRLLLGRAYHILGIIYYQSDLSLGLKYREQALEIYRAVGEVRGVGSMTHNLGVLYLELGLHKRAQTLFNEAVQIAETSGSRASFLLSLLMASSSGFQAGDTEAAEQANQRVIEEAHEAGYQGLEALASAMRGWMLWERGDLDPAVKIMQAAVEQVEVMPAYLPFVLGWLGRMYLERGDIPAALQTTEKALEWVGELHQPYFKETPYWSRYQVLQHIAKTPPEAEKAWDTLLQARDVLLDRIENIADRGLRRSYLSRRFANPDIILEWARHAYQRGESLAPLMEHAHPAGDIQQQFKRLLDTGTRLAAQSDPDRILVFVMDEFIELSGAERAFIALREEGDESLPQVVLFQGLGDEDETYAYEQAFPLIDQAVLSRQAVLSQKVGAAPEGEPPEIHLRSVVVVPLVSHSRVMGVLYGDIREIFTPFNRQDANLLTLLANQAAAALENANWTRTLEQRVRDRTIELETINKIGEGLLANLDLDGVLQVVGEHVQERFGTQNMIIAITEPSKGALLAPYLILNGKRLEPIQVAADQGVTSVVIRRNAPLLIASFEEIQDYPYVMPKEMQDNPPEEMSWIGVPLRRGEEAIGALIVFELRDHAYDESHVRLLSTIAANMGVALENARLFDEVQKSNRKLTEALEQQTATSDILRVIAESPTDIQPVLEVIARHAAQLSGSEDAIIAIKEEETLKVVAHDGDVPMIPVGEGIPFNRDSVAGRAMIEGRPLQAIHNQRGVKSKYPQGDKVANKYGYRTSSAVPLMREGKAVGVITIRRTKPILLTDKQILLVQSFANQAAIAVENVRLFNETTRLLKETEARNAELAVINSVQSGLASKLDIHSIFELVGERISEIFPEHSVALFTYESETDTAEAMFMLERGSRHYPPPFQPGPIGKHMNETKKPLMLSTRGEFEAIGAITIEGTEASQSGIYAPLVVDDDMIGALNIENPDREHTFTESDLRLVTTLANSMSVALENARLFDETQRLLKETEERNAELAVINSVQEGLVAQMDIQAIFDLVGDTIYAIFDTQVVIISTFDHARERKHIRYNIEKGKRYYPEPSPFNDLQRHLIRTRQPVVILDNASEKRADFGMDTAPGTEPSKSLVFVPLLVGERVNGFISLQNVDREHAFSGSDVRLLQTLANSMSVALENARLFDETQRLLKETEERNAELAVINSVQQGLAAELDIQAIFDLVGDTIRDIFDAQVVLINTYNLENERVHNQYSIEKGKQIFPDPFPFNELHRHIIRTHKTILINENAEEVGAELGMHTIPGTEAAESLVFVPMVVGEHIKGVVSLQNTDREGAFSDSDVRLLQTLANSMSVALENARLFDETQRLLKETEERNAELAVINKIQEGLAAELDLDAIYHLVGDAIQAIFNAQSVGLAVIDYENELNQIKYLMEDGKKHFPDPLPLDLTRPSQAHLVESRQTLYIRNREEQRVFSMGDATIEGTLPMQSMIFVPLVVRDVTQGVITLQSEQEEAFSDSDIRLLNTIANTMSVALENARLFDETQRLLEETEQRASELAIINDVQAGLVARVEMGEIYNLVGDRVQEIFDAEVVVINRFDLENRRSHYEYTVEKGERFSVEPQPFNPIIEDYIENKHTFLANEGVAEILEAAGAPVVAGEAPLSILAVPLMSSGRVVGSISLQNVSREHAFNPSDVQLLETLAASLSIALENARLFDETQRRARETAALVEVGHDISATLDLSNVLKRIANHARELLEASDCAVFLPDETGEIMRGSIALGPIAEQVKASTIRPGIGVLGDLWLRRESEVINDAANDPRAVTIAGTETQRDERMLAAPLLSGENVYGMMAVWRTGKPYSEIDLNFLEGLARHAAIAIQNARLFEEALAARQAAEQANKAKSTFLANMSHELRTPLNAITGFTRIVKRKGADVLPDKQVQNLDKVLVSADHLLGLINTVLDIAKIEAGRMEVQPASFDFHPLADLVLATTQPLVESSVKLVSEVPAELPRLHTDQDKLKQIMINLLSNAAKFTHEGRITLRARAGDGLLSVEVQDTGIGISPDKLEKIFEEFQQADTSTTRQYGGTGLGLSISKSLAQLLGGDMTATSVEGGGSTFTLSIPLRYGETPLPERSEPAPLADIHKPTGQPLILSIDDDPNVHDLLKENLGERGYQVIGALSGEEGLRLARELSPFAITLDIMMPHKDGWQVLHELKADPATRDIPVILVTIVDKQALGYQLGAADYLVKPLEEDAVYAALQHIPSNKSQGDPPAHLLVVDDDPNIPDMVRQLLADAPYRIDSESNGQAALEAIRRQPPDVILLDLMMPRMDGFALIESLRKEDIRVPIIVLTAKTLNTVDLEILEESVERIIQKNGLDRERLLAELRRTLEEVGKWREDGLSTKDEGRGAKGEG